MITLNEKQKILELHEKGASYIEIAKQLSIDRHTVGKVIYGQGSKKTAEKASLREFKIIDDGRENIKKIIPGIVNMLRSDSEIRRNFAKDGIFLENAMEKKLMAEIKAIDSPDGLNYTERLKLVTDLIRYFTNSYGDTNGRVSSDEVYTAITGAEELLSLLYEKGFKTGEMVNAATMLLELYELGLDSPGLRKLITFVESAADQKFDLGAFTMKYNLEEVLIRMVSYDENRKEARTIEKRLADLRDEESRLKENNAKLTRIENLDAEIDDLIVKIDGLASENNRLLKINDMLIHHFGDLITYDNLREKVSEMNENYQHLMGKTTDLEIMSTRLEREIVALEERKQYLDSGLFIRDLMVEQLTKSYMRSVGSPTHIPLAAIKYGKMKGIAIDVTEKQPGAVGKPSHRIPPIPRLVN